MQKSWLHEEILLLALKDKAGTVEAGVRCEFAIAGAILAELLVHGRIQVVEAKKKKLADLVDATPLGDLLLDECLAKIGDAKRRAPLDTWVVRFSG
ncbi:MAG: GPP34 family phosphoprotein, partial [bacterium]|nr:GPP34 family phosphoprotein [bacterium]